MCSFPSAPSTLIATGYSDPSAEKSQCLFQKAATDGSNQMIFPLFAAGMLASTRGMARFLQHLLNAFQNLDGSGGISHDTAVLMLGSFDSRLRDTSEFMSPGSTMGIGVFLIRAGANWIAVHQGANEGFRCLYCYCYRGPNAHSGFVVASNGSNNAVFVNALVSQLILRRLNWQFIDYRAFLSTVGFSFFGFDFSKNSV